MKRKEPPEKKKSFWRQVGRPQGAERSKKITEECRGGEGTGFAFYYMTDVARMSNREGEREVLGW